mmetsp:Transcript_26780/g.46174  ORF Transcript_26780/g.46174 Transcript_26780/m.46174 type:complete len:82 (+) Transcript_26780:146-391(+)
MRVCGISMKEMMFSTPLNGPDLSRLNTLFMPILTVLYTGPYLRFRALLCMAPLDLGRLHLVPRTEQVPLPPPPVENHWIRK